MTTNNTQEPKTSRIPCSRAVWYAVSLLKRPGQNFDELLLEMIDAYKKVKDDALIEHLDKVANEDDFVPLEELNPIDVNKVRELQEKIKEDGATLAPIEIPLPDKLLD